MNSEALNRLTTEIENSFNYSHADAEKYAKWLVDSCLKEYNKAYEMCMVTRED